MVLGRNAVLTGGLALATATITALLSGWLQVRAVEVQVGAGRGGAALVLVPRAVDGRAVRVLGRRAAQEQAELADLHAGPELDRQRGHVGQLERHVPGEAGVDPPGR